jgi:hypothetical protein
MSATQFDGPLKRETCDIVVGFDFGTSCSKVLLRSPYHYQQKALAVRFEEVGHSSCPYLLPSVVWVGDGGRISLKPQSQGHLLRDIKYHLMRREPVPAIGRIGAGSETDAAEVAVAFLALALRETRDWFLKRQRSLYGEFSLRWTLNIGLPSADFADEILCKTYDRVAKAAWALSLKQGHLTLRDAKEMLGSHHAIEKLPEHKSAEIKAIPEVAAAVAGYARSVRREEGLHVLLDIGASTLDLCGFILHERDGDDCYELLTADVCILGASMLYRERVSAVRNAVDEHMKGLWDEYDPVTPMKENVEDYSPCHDRVASAIKKGDADYSKQCRSALSRTLKHLKAKRDPLSSRWHSKLPLFLSGGGAGMSFYRSVVADVSNWMRTHWNPGDRSDGKETHDNRNEGIEIRSLVKPQNFEADIDDHTNHRLAVAWGLSYPETDIGEVSRPSEIGDVPEQDSYDYGGKVFVGKEMV